MKTLVLFFLAMLSGVAFADDKLGSSCQDEWALSQVGREVLICKSRTWSAFSTIRDRNVLIKAVLTHGGKEVYTGGWVALDGKPISDIKKEITTFTHHDELDASGKKTLIPATMTTGTCITLAAIVVNDDSINVFVNVKGATVDSTAPKRVNQYGYEEPVMTSAGAQEYVLLHKGTEQGLLFGTVAEPYVLMLSATPM